MLLSQSKFAGACGVSRQAISKAVKENKLTLDGKKIDTENQKNVLWVTGNLKRKKAFNQFVGTGTLEKKDAKKTPPQKVQPVKSQNKDISLTAPEEDGGLSENDISYRKAVADMSHSQEKVVKLKIENQEKINSLASREKMTIAIERFVNYVYTGIKRVSSTSLTDISKDILNVGTVENQHFKQFEDAGTELVDNARKQLINDIINLKL